MHKDFRRFFSIAAKVNVAHVISSAAYQLLTKSSYEGNNPISLTFIRTPPNRNFGIM